MKKNLLLLALTASAAASSVHAQGSEKFDLTCKGERLREIDGTPEPYEYGFRVDLAEGQWCWAHCDTVFKLGEVTADRLVLNRSETDTARSRRSHWNEISRTSGRHELLSIEVRPLPSYYKVTGQCSRAPFTGFPSTLF